MHTYVVAVFVFIVFCVGRSKVQQFYNYHNVASSHFKSKEFISMHNYKSCIYTSFQGYNYYRCQGGSYRTVVRYVVIVH